MIRIGITGQTGFIGKHLYNTIAFYPNEFERVPFEKYYFDDNELLNAFVKKCDVIVHLAGMNRHNDPDHIYATNIRLTTNLIASLKHTKSKAHVIFSSSTQEEKDNPYGNSKKKAKNLLIDWSNENNSLFTGMIIPNVFGPFGAPYYNSVISTFCYQLTHGETPKIEIDSEIKLIYVAELVSEILHVIRSKTASHNHLVKNTWSIRVADLLDILYSYTESYIKKGSIPIIKNNFELNLFNTFRSYDNINRYPIKFVQYSDARGAFSEIIRLNIGGQVSFSTTLPGSTRGNHFHTRKIERFAVIKGKALIQLRRIGSNEIHDFYLDGNEPSYVDMPIWYVHNIKNIGTDELYTIFWINEFYNSEDPDTYFEAV